MCKIIYIFTILMENLVKSLFPIHKIMITMFQNARQHNM